MKGKYRTLEEVRANYPINCIIYGRARRYRGYYYTENDLKIYKRDYHDVEIISDSEVLFTKKTEKFCRGYGFDGEFWYPLIESSNEDGEYYIWGEME